MLHVSGVLSFLLLVISHDMYMPTLIFKNHLFSSLHPVNQSLIHSLAHTFTALKSEIPTSFLLPSLFPTHHPHPSFSFIETSMILYKSYFILGQFCFHRVINLPIQLTFHTSNDLFHAYIVVVFLPCLTSNISQ